MCRQSPARQARPALGAGGTDNDTTTCIVADAAGNMVAATPSGFSGVVAGSTGVWLGSRLQSFNAWEGHPNCIEPGKRPRITLTPGLVLKDGKPLMAVSVAGGDGQDQAALQVVLDVLEFGLSPADAIYQACLVRFRPIMMTTIAALFGAIPLAIGQGVGAELRRPLGVSIVGGLIVSQMLTLYSTPVIYLMFEQIQQWWRRRRGTLPAAEPALARAQSLGSAGAGPVA